MLTSNEIKTKIAALRAELAALESTLDQVIVEEVETSGEDALFTVPQAAIYLRMTVQTVRNMLSTRNKLKAAPSNPRDRLPLMIYRSECDRYVNDKKRCGRKKLADAA